MVKQLRPAILVFLTLIVLTGVIYPVFITGVAQLVFPQQANGSIIVKDGRVVGSSLIGQSFNDPRYFWGRLSATSPYPYNAAASAGSNLGPLNDALTQAVQLRITALHQMDPGNPKPVPADLVTASGSGLDPHISPASADYQVPRIARVRGMDVTVVRQLVTHCTTGRFLGILGEPTVNVLELNLALDQAQGK